MGGERKQEVVEEEEAQGKEEEAEDNEEERNPEMAQDEVEKDKVEIENTHRMNPSPCCNTIDAMTINANNSSTENALVLDCDESTVHQDFLNVGGREREGAAGGGGGGQEEEEGKEDELQARAEGGGGGKDGGGEDGGREWRHARFPPAPEKVRSTLSIRFVH